MRPHARTPVCEVHRRAIASNKAGITTNFHYLSYIYYVSRTRNCQDLHVVETAYARERCISLGHEFVAVSATVRSGMQTYPLLNAQMCLLLCQRDSFLPMICTF